MIEKKAIRLAAQENTPGTQGQSTGILDTTKKKNMSSRLASTQAVKFSLFTPPPANYQSGTQTTRAKSAANTHRKIQENDDQTDEKTPIIALLTIRLLVVLPWRRLLKRERSKKQQYGTKRQRKTIIVLGSGGHTSEMLALLAGVDLSVFIPRTYVVGNTDKISGIKADVFEQTNEEKGKKKYSVKNIPRSREVLQSALNSIWPTLKSIIYSINLVFRERPEVILCNGPGTCFPICVAGFLLKFFWNRHLRIVFVESYCRVTSLSTTGKLLYYLPIADGFVVHWPQLKAKYTRTETLGAII
ncbi:MAG: putative UDP-N-acetylglucosamine transferase subunit ALG14 [Streblomastix strix]|uniref:UDP-N-acetylglucosamine transferase subunit ALG14 n=1 Tax=Streblomastix strix TaxID=222440 RepID=A0A5J4WBB0_9EUKA|nr:MAG: putative UDP-N-acetylglucosamine transferase subunit ALG14 [Streblomastix strix]